MSTAKEKEKLESSKRKTTHRLQRKLRGINSSLLIRKQRPGIVGLHAHSAEGKNDQPIILHSAKLSFTNDGKIKTFSDTQSLRVCS